MKRIISFIMVLALMLTMSIPAFATEPTNGTITITNATIGEEYKLYKIFDATLAFDENGNVVYEDGKPSISYTIDTKVEKVVGSETVLVDNPLYVAMFTAEGSTGANYFTFTPVEGENKGYIEKKESVSKTDIQTYLDTLIANNAEAAAFACVDSKTITSGKIITFEDLEYGYYMIDKANATYVTLTSTTPSVNVIDKNQMPGEGFTKEVWDEDAKKWVSGSESTTASVGDILDFKIEFEATNYSGEKPVKYYTVKDTKGSALWVEFNSITVEIDDPSRDNPETEANEGIIPLNKGYYSFAGTASGIPNTNEWTLFGNGWTAEEKAAEDYTQFANDAEWYLIHRGYDEFDIVIPWMDDYTFTSAANGFTMNHTGDSEAIYSSPVKVVVTYRASVEHTANIGNEDPRHLWNKANLSWTSDTTTSHPDGPETNVIVYALGLIKVDGNDDSKRLAGATFELYRDTGVKDENQKPVMEAVYVLPTDVKGVYIVDDLNATNEISGTKKESARVTYAAYIDDYLGEGWDEEGAVVQKNEVTSQVNGKILIKGLEAGKYYLVETDAPDGYNILPTATEVEVGKSNGRFFVIADTNGNVYDVQTAGSGQIRYECIADSVQIENNKGVELPATGGEGAMKLITFGTITAIAFAALLITHKKMTVYED